MDKYLVDSMRTLKSTPSGDKHAELYDRIQHRIAIDPYVFAETLTHWQELGMTDREACELYNMGYRGGSVSRKDNPHLALINAALRQHLSRLSPCVVHTLEWLERVHGY